MVIVMPTGTDVNRHPMPRAPMASASIPRVPNKSSDDVEIENRVRGHIRAEMIDRGLGVNAMNEKLGLGRGVLSKILNEERGFKAGFVLRVLRKLTVPAKILLEEDPEDRFMEPGVPDPRMPKPRPRK